MSDVDPAPGVVVRGARRDVPGTPVLDQLPGREVALGGSTVVRRLLPTLRRRMVGAWCFVDHYGPDDITGRPGMQVPPHPHIGLQTVSWLLDGEIRHRDSLGNDVTIRPGQLALMTAGHAIAHSEQSPAAHPALLHGAQLWVALPGAVRGITPSFEHHTDLPVRTDVGARLLLLGGEPFVERLVMWWNFVAADGEEIAAAREDWVAGRRFGEVVGGRPPPAPPLPSTPLVTRGRAR